MVSGARRASTTEYVTRERISSLMHQGRDCACERLLVQEAFRVYR